MTLIPLKALAAVVLVAAALGAAGICTGVLDKPSPPANAMNMIGTPQPAQKIHLYPAVRGTSVSPSWDYTPAAGLHARPFSHKPLPNGGALDVYLRSDDRKPDFSLEWFPAGAGGKTRLHAATIFGAGGVAVDGQEIFRPDGTRLMHGIRLPSGDYQTTSYYEDGVSPELRSVIGRSPNKLNQGLYLLSETRWRKEDGTTVYTNVLNSDDTRTIVVYDNRGEPVQVSHISPQIAGSTVLGYYPGTTKIKLEAVSDYYRTTVKMHRLDGTLAMTAEIAATGIMVTYFGTDGKQMTLEQHWIFDRVSENGVVRLKNLRLSDVTEPDAEGNTARQWEWDVVKPFIWMYEQHNVVLDGKPLRRLNSFYRESDGSLERTDFYPADPSINDWSVNHSAGENIRPPAVPPADLVPLPFDLNVLPVPFPIRSMYG